MKTFSRLCLLTLFPLLFACEGDPQQSIRETPQGDGPTIVYAPMERPDSLTFFPTDLATRRIDNETTGRQINISQDRDLHVAHHLRSQLNRLDGFGVASTIAIPFEKPLDLASVTEGSIRLFNVSPRSVHFGEEVALDLQGTAYPRSFRPRGVFPYDLLEDFPDLFFGELNGFEEERIQNYEVETNTLLVQPYFPLREQTTYAVVLTETLKGEDGEPIRSPFPWVHHAAEYATLKPITQWIDPEDIAFTWSFTTRSVTPIPIAIRDGLDGIGPLGWLRELYPGKWLTFQDLNINDAPEDPEDRDHPFIMDGEFLPTALASVGALAGGGLESITFEHVDYALFGTFESVNVRDEEDHAIWADLKAGTIAHKPSEVGFLLTVPKTTEEFQPPFRVMLYNHGSRTSRLEQILMANDFSRAGIAVISIDAAGHGPFGGDLRAIVEREAADYPPELVSLLAGSIAQSFLGGEYDYSDKDLDAILNDLEENGLWKAMFVTGRAEDHDGDGLLLSGDNYFVPNPFALSSAGFQTVVDNLVLFRILSRLSPDAIPGPGIDDPQNADEEDILAYMHAGDFNADGILDVGGPDGKFSTMGTSMGAFHASILLPLEPGITTGVSNVGGGGITEIMLRSSLAEAIDPIMTEPLGPIIVGCPVPRESEEEEEELLPVEVALTWNNWSVRCRDIATIEFAEKASNMSRIPVIPGGSVTLTNPRLAGTGENDTRTVPIAEDGGFGLGIAADKGDELLMEVRDKDDNVVLTKTIIALMEGSGHSRNTPRFRRLVGTAQSAIDLMEPLAWARHIVREPLPGSKPNNVLHLATTGDITVPFSSMLAWDRAVGLLGEEPETAIDVTNVFVEEDRILGGDYKYDFEDLLNTGDGPGPLPEIKTDSGESAVRFPFTGDHEYLGLLKPDDPFDWAMYSRNQVIHFLRTDGKEIREDLCMEDNTCAWLPSPSAPAEETEETP